MSLNQRKCDRSCDKLILLLLNETNYAKKNFSIFFPELTYQSS